MNGAAKQPALHSQNQNKEPGRSKELSGSPREKPPSNLHFFLAGALSFFAFCLAELRKSWSWCPRSGTITEEVQACEASLILWGLERGAVTSTTCLCVSKGHRGCPKWPSLETLSFEASAGFCLVSVHTRLGFTAGSWEQLGACTSMTHSTLTAVSPSSSLLPPFAPCSGTKPKPLSAPQTPPG